MLSVHKMSVSFITRHFRLHVVRGISFTLQTGSRMAILGETGCGKSVMAMALFRLLPENTQTEGTVHLDGHKDLFNMPLSAIRRLCGDVMVLVPQNPMSYLNPVYSVGFHLKESIRRVAHLPRSRVKKKALSLLSQAGFKDPFSVSALFPHQLSGGMAQRVLLAMGLTAAPTLIVLDEPTRGLDMKARDQYLSLSSRLYNNAAFLMITHDLSAALSCDRVMVMYAGHFVEEGPSEKVLENPLHPYTKGLVAAHPSKGFNPIPGMPPSFSNPVAGCSFSNRCSYVSDLCKKMPPMHHHRSHGVRCHHA